MNVEMDLCKDVLQRQAFERLQMGNVLRSFSEAVVEHPSDDVLDVASQRMSHARVHVVLRHATVERHMRTGERGKIKEGGKDKEITLVKTTAPMTPNEQCEQIIEHLS